jgi:uncharacterized membrane protein
MTQPTLSPWQRSFVLGAQRFSYWVARHWLAVINLFLAIYLLLPFAAPVFIKVGWEGPARVIYTVYKPLCHQLSFRSFFLFGEESVYPREEYAERFDLDHAHWPDLFAQAREFTGDETLGFKVALCQRDVAIFLALLLGGLAFAVLRRRGIRAMPFWLFILVGVVPMALDGGSQFISLMPFLTTRESVWQLRLLTGALFGFSIVWLAYPYVQTSMDETSEVLAERYGWEETAETAKPTAETTREKVLQLLEDHDVLQTNDLAHADGESAEKSDLASAKGDGTNDPS